MAGLSAACSPADNSGTGKDRDENAQDGNNNQDGKGGDDKTGGLPPLPDRPSLAELEEYWAIKSCRVFACINRSRETQEICEKAKKAAGFPFDMFREAQRAVENGRAEFVEQAGAYCAQVLRNIDIETDCFGPAAFTYRERYFKELEELCSPQAILAGKVEAEGECNDNAECVTGADCLFDRKPDCQGVCVKRLLIGESCEGKWGDCVEVAQCTGGICTSKQFKEAGEMCFSHSECGTGFCAWKPEGMFSVCLSGPNQLSGECGDYDSHLPGVNYDHQCAGTLYCRGLPASTGMAGLCSAPGSPGDECGYGPKCSGNQACAGFFFKYGGGTSTGNCVARPSNIGEPCVPIGDDFDYGDTGCLADLSCNPETETCEEAPKVGEPCAKPGDRCGFEMYCDSEGICRAKKSAGEEASGPEQCLGYFNSSSGECQEIQAQPGCF